MICEKEQKIEQQSSLVGAEEALEAKPKKKQRVRTVTWVAGRVQINERKKFKKCCDCNCPLAPDRGRSPRCEPCASFHRKVINRMKYMSDKPAILARHKARHTLKRDEIYAQVRKRKLERETTDYPMETSFYQARSRARRRGIPFSIQYSDLMPAPKVCPVLGIPLTYNTGKRTDSSPSIDKIKPELGYIPGNVAIMSFRANRFKSNATVAELEKVIEFMKGHE